MSKEPVVRTTVRLTASEEQALRRFFTEGAQESLPALIRKAMRDAILVEQTKSAFSKGKYAGLR